MLSGWGKLVANKFFGFSRGTNRSSYTQLYVAFFLSAIFHTFGDSIHRGSITYRHITFFLLQAVAITLEDLVIYCSTRLLLQRKIKLNTGGHLVHAVVRVIGYSWVLLWLCWTLPMWVDESSVAGSHNKDRGRIAQFLADKWQQWV